VEAERVQQIVYFQVTWMLEVLVGAMVDAVAEGANTSFALAEEEV
jgi:hypothetical protein